MDDFKKSFGWELLYRVIENSVKSKQDVLTALVHFTLIKNGFKCIGTGSETVLTGNEEESEVLPIDWNKNLAYALRYTFNGKLYILRGVMTEGDILFNMLLVPDVSVSKVLFNIENTVKEIKGHYETVIPNYKEVVDSLQKDLLRPIFEGLNKEATTQTIPVRDDDDDDYDEVQHNIPSVFYTRNPETLRQVGQSDLDPFRNVGPLGPIGGGGGMLFDPFQRRGPVVPEGPPGVPGVLPRGAVPPGARFDPFGPPGLDPRRGGSRGGGRGGFGVPDPDHLPPPGYDDMFM